MSDSSDERLRVALLAGTLGQGGAEKQLIYTARALLGANVDVRVYSLTQGEFYEPALRKMGLSPVWVGRFANPVFRTAVLTVALRSFKPHVIQSTHAFTNLYAAIVGQALNAISLGAMRSSLRHSAAANGRWTRWLVTAPDGLVANSQTALHEIAESKLIERERLCLVPNAIELTDFDQPSSAADSRGGSTEEGQAGPVALFLGRLVPVKRLDRFLRSLAVARQQHPSLKGVVVGDGPEREAMERLSAEIGLQSNNVEFLGQRSDVPELLRRARMLVFCSDDEGFPNVLLEAMAAYLPIITTPVGDATLVVQDGVTGYVVPFDDIEVMAERMVRLAKSPDLCQQLGAASRRRVEQHYGFEGLAANLIAAYRSIARQQNKPGLIRLLPVQQ